MRHHEDLVRESWLLPAGQAHRLDKGEGGRQRRQLVRAKLDWTRQGALAAWLRWRRLAHQQPEPRGGLEVGSTRHCAGHSGTNILGTLPNILHTTFNNLCTLSNILRTFSNILSTLSNILHTLFNNLRTLYTYRLGCHSTS